MTKFAFKGPRKRGNIVAETLLRKHCFLAAQTGKHLLRKQNVSEKKSETFFVSRKQKMFPQQMFPARANGETFRETTMFPQQCFLPGALKLRCSQGQPLTFPKILLSVMDVISYFAHFVTDINVENSTDDTMASVVKQESEILRKDAAKRFSNAKLFNHAA